MYEIDQIYALRGKSREIPYFFGEIPGEDFRLILPRKIPGSRDFAKSHPENPGIENSRSRWSLTITGGGKFLVPRTQKLIML